MNSIGTILNIFGIVLALFLFGIMILSHEMGHFISAKWAGVLVHEFSIGMGPKIFSFSKNSTDYSLRLFPIGGYVAMAGEEDEDNSIGNLYSVPAWKRIVIMASGGIMNLIFGLIIIIILSSQMSTFGTNIIADFADNAVSNELLMKEDKIVAVNGEKSFGYYDVIYSLVRDTDGKVDIDVLRNGKTVTISSVPFVMTDYDGTNALSIDFIVYGVEKTLLSTINNSLKWTGAMIRLVWRSLGDIISGEFALSSLSGPVALTNEISKAAFVDIKALLMILGLISVNLGIMNLLPLPALDGGRIVFAFIELITGKAISRKVESSIHSIGMIFLIILSIIVAGNDIMKLLWR